MSEIMISRRHVEYIAESRIPKFSYSGNYLIINDDETEPRTNWRIKFLTSGMLTFHTLPSDIDLFLVGGGGGGGTSSSNAHPGSGGGGGYTNTHRQLNLATGIDYEIIIGAGGATNSNGGETSAFGYAASGGYGAVWTGNGGNGGSGGGGKSRYGKQGVGGSDGGNGTNGAGSSEFAYGGTGQGSTTREFAEPDGDLYAGGGGAGKQTYDGYAAGSGGAGGGANGNESAQPNTGGGGGGGGGGTSISGGSGGSGIVIIRNAR